MTTSTQTVRDIALENPASIRVFEEFGIDYCCGGRIPLAEACAKKNLAVGDVMAALEQSASPAALDHEWTAASLGTLVSHIVNTHHAYVKRELPRLTELAEKVVRRHGDTKPELPVIQSKLAELGEEFTQHCSKEEVVLFPYITKFERSVVEGTPKPRSCFGSVTHPIAMMAQEHDIVGALMAELRDLSQGYVPPVGACPTFHAFYSGLHEFEQDLHKHVHLENNILFPRAIAMEAPGS